MRIFVALAIEEEIRRKIATFVDGARKFASEARWVRPESLHVTLKFIGEQSVEGVENIKRELAGISACPFKIRFRGYGFFPSARAPRVFWIGIEAGTELAALARRVDEALLAVPREEHPFSPHLTLARDSGRSGSPRKQHGDTPHSRFHELQHRLESLSPLEFGTMTADAFLLYQSRMGPGGSQYTKIAEFPLNPPGQESDPNRRPHKLS